MRPRMLKTTLPHDGLWLGHAWATALTIGGMTFRGHQRYRCGATSMAVGAPPDQPGQIIPDQFFAGAIKAFGDAEVVSRHRTAIDAAHQGVSGPVTSRD